MSERLFEIPVQNHVPIGGFSDSALGGLSEAKAISELLERGHRVAKPVVDDDGVDLIVNYSTLVQVKATRRRHAASGMYRWMLANGSAARAHKTGRGAHKRGLAPHVDILMCHCLEESVWWIIPADQVVGAKYAIGIGSPRDQWRNAWELFDR